MDAVKMMLIIDYDTKNILILGFLFYLFIHSGNSFLLHQHNFIYI